MDTELQRLLAGFIRDQVGSPIDPGADLRERAEVEGVGGILGAMSQPQSEARLEALAHFRLNARRLLLLRELSAALQEAGGRVLLIKGGALLHGVYAGRIGLRPLSDLDLVVEPGGAGRCQQALAATGCRGRDLGIWVKDELMLDLHADILGSTRIGHRASAFRFDPAELWQRAYPTEQAPGVWIMCPEHEFLLGAVHALKHSYTRLIWLVDLALLSQGVERQAIVTMAWRTGCQRVVAYAYWLLGELFHLPASLDGLPRLNLLERWFLSAVVRRSQLPYAGELVMLFSLSGLRLRLAYLLQVLFPAQELDRDLPFPMALVWRLKSLAKLLRKPLRQPDRQPQGPDCEGADSR